MKKIAPYPEARRILSKVHKDKAFWLCTNENLFSLASLLASLEKVTDEVFRYHITRDKNDFEKWIRDVVKDRELAREIARVKTKETLIRKINERVILLKKVVKRHKLAIERRKAKKTKKMKKAKKRTTATSGRRKKATTTSKRVKKTNASGRKKATKSAKKPTRKSSAKKKKR